KSCRGTCVQLVESFLAAIVREDGESLVLHVGERPVVVAPRGPIEIASGVMTLEAMDSLLLELLPADSRHALEEFGAVEAELPPSAMLPDERFAVVAARGGDDIWTDIRRRRPVRGAAPPRPSEAPMPPGRDLPPSAGGPAFVLPLSRHAVRPETALRPG